MAQRLTDKLVKELPLPAAGNRVHYDDEIRGFGIRVTAKGARAFILNYRIKGRERRYTIGEFGSWKTVAARQEAKALKVRVDRGDDPLGEEQAERKAPTVAELCERFEREYLPRRRPLTQRDYARAIKNDILPVLRNKKVADVSYADLDNLHRKITERGSPYSANRAIAVASKMFAQAIKWKWRPDNPAKGIERNDEQPRARYLTGDELKRLAAALAKHDDNDAANIIRLLLFSGARRMEAMSARWAQFDLDAGTWTKPGSTTKQKTLHHVPLSSAALTLLRQLRADAPIDAEFVFPGRDKGHRVEIKRNWARICKDAQLEGVRVHDLRHTYASVLASAGLSLPIIGKLLGHSNPHTTQRYAHLINDALRIATERAGAIISGAQSAEVVSAQGGE